MQKLAEICIQRPVFATMLILSITFIGAFAYRFLGVDLFPKVDFPTITVTTTLRGASPEEMETEISKKIEESVNTLPGIDEMRSVSGEGVSQVFITFILERNVEQAAQDVRDKVNLVLRDLPRDIDPPIVEKLDPDASPVMSLAVSANRSAREITEVADKKIKQQLESLNGVGQVKFIGNRKRQIQLWLDTQKLASYNLTVQQVEAAVDSQNLEVPGGRLNEGDKERVLRTLGRVQKSADFNKIIVSNINGLPVRVSDLGYTEDGVEEPRTLARLDGKEAIILEVRKQSGTNTIQVVDLVKERLKDIQGLLPADYKIEVIRDQSSFIKGSFEAIKEHLILGGIFTALVVLLFMRNFRSTIIAGIAIPTSIISTFAVMYYMDFTLNQMTMLALVLSVGIVIDDAIVVLENIDRFIEEKQMSAMQAAQEATKEIGLAVMATTLSLIIIFLPVAFMGGIVGRFMKSFGLTCVFSIGVSLFISFTLTPMLCSRFLKAKKESHKSAKSSFFYSLIERSYMGLLRFSLRHRLSVIILSILVIITIVPFFKAVGKDFITQDDTSDFQVDIRLPEGTSLEASSERLKAIEADLKGLNGVIHLLTTVGADAQKTVNLASVYVRIIDVTQRQYPQAQVMEQARRLLTKYKDMRIAVNYIAAISGGGRSNTDLQYSVRGPDLNKLSDYSNKIIEVTRKIPGVVDVDSSFITGKPEARVYIDRERAADLGVRVSDIANALRVLVGGDDRASNYREGEDRYDVLIRAQLKDRDSISALSLISVPSNRLGSVRLDQVVRIDSGTGPSQIDRYNRQRQVTITGNIERGQSLAPVIEALNAGVAKLQLSSEYSAGLQGRSRELGRAAANFLIAFVLSFAFMYMILAAQFESFLDPVIILLSLPLSIPFALLSLVFFHQTLNIFSALGVLMLFGVVKKNSILQIDHANTLSRRGIELNEATLKACQDRLRPILMTTFALVAGMLPMAFGQGPGSASRRSVAIVVIGGQSLCLLLTLIVTPVAYTLFGSLANNLKKLNTKWQSRKATSAIVLILISSAVLLASGFHQPTYAQQQFARIGSDETKPLSLSLTDAIRLALENNADIEIERINAKQAGFDLTIANGAYDPIIGLNHSFSRQNVPITSSLGGSTTGVVTNKNISTDFSFRGFLPHSGATYDITASELRADTTSFFATLNPQTTTTLNFTLRQPLLRNRQIDDNRRRIRVAQRNLDITDAQFRQRIIDIIAQVERAYWELVFARQSVVIAQDSVKLAETQYERVRRLIDAGSQAPVDLIQVETQLQLRKENVLGVLDSISKAENNLKLLILPDRNAAEWSQALVPTDLPMVKPVSLDLDSTVSRALSNRPEIKQLDVQKELINDNLKYLHNQTKPQVDIVATYGLTGLAGAQVSTSNPFSAGALIAPLTQRVNLISTQLNLAPLPPTPAATQPGFLVGGIGQSLGNLFANRFNTFRVGVQILWSVRNQSVTGQIGRNELEIRKAGLQRQRLVTSIEAEVRNALQSLNTTQQRIETTRAARTAAEKQLDSEQRRYEAGLSTNFLVLTRQQELSEVRGRELKALTDYDKAIADLQRACGTNMSTYNIETK